MAKRRINTGAVDQTVDVFVLDSSSSTGAGLTGLVFNTAGLTCYYRKGATGTPTALSLVTQTVGGAHADGGFVAADGTNMPGQYRLDLPDTLWDTAGMAYVYLKGAANMAPVVMEFEVGPTPANVVQVNGGTAGVTDLYHAEIHFTRDQTNTQDEWTVTWFKNGVRLTTGVTSPTLQAVKRVDGTDLFAAAAMTEIGTTESFKLDRTTTERLTVGEAVVVVASATIDSSTRTFSRIVSRDSS
jgi:hypothetical protein